jgi:hypothetical protein
MNQERFCVSQRAAVAIYLRSIGRLRDTQRSLLRQAWLGVKQKPVIMEQFRLKRPGFKNIAICAQEKKRIFD